MLGNELKKNTATVNERLNPEYFIRLMQALGALLESTYDAHSPVTSSQQRLLRVLMRKDGQTQTEIASTLHIHKVSVGLHVNELKALGLVKRLPHPTDGRAKCIFLSDLFHTYIPEGRRVFSAIHATALEGISRENYAIFINCLEKMGENLMQLRKQDGRIKPVTIKPIPDSHRDDKATAVPYQPRRKP